MPRVRKVLNGFTASELTTITGVSPSMVDYLLRHGFLRPGHGGVDENPRGKVRYYTYRDLVIARLIQRLRESGVRLGRLKAAVQILSSDEFWADDVDPARGLSWVVSDGRDVHLRDRDGFLDALDGSGQRSFAFVVNMTNLRGEVQNAIPKAKREGFTMARAELIYEFQKPKSRHG